jgi:hypothetical protein
MHFELNYGRGTLPVDLPKELDVTILPKPRMPVLQDPRRAVGEAFANPVNCPPLPELAHHGNRTLTG